MFISLAGFETVFIAKLLGKDNKNVVLWHLQERIHTLVESVATRVMQKMRCKSLSTKGKGYVSLSAYV